ncbi:MAG: hypothetical protein AAF327_12380 [Cyanobacteria bacterium P01_A01_bin.37]
MYRKNHYDQASNVSREKFDGIMGRSALHNPGLEYKSFITMIGYQAAIAPLVVD